MTRYAKVTGAERTINAYMPANYEARRAGQFSPHDTTILIKGEDAAGWNMDDYVIPRLASGLLFAEEISPAEYHVMLEAARESDLIEEAELRGISGPDY